MILEQIRKDVKVAMMNNNAELRDYLRVVLGEVEREIEVVNEESMVKILKRLYKNAEICNNEWEKEVLSRYLPSELSENEIRSIVQNLCTEHNFTKSDMGKIMGMIRTIDGMNMKIASSIVKEELQ